MKDNEALRRKNFITSLIKLSPDEAFGVARMLNISLIDEENQPVDGLTFTNRLVEKFKTLTRTQQVNLLYIMNAAVSKEGGKKKHVTKNKKNRKKLRH